MRRDSMIESVTLPEVVLSDLQEEGDTSSGPEVSVDGLNSVDAAARSCVLQHARTHTHARTHARTHAHAHTHTHTLQQQFMIT